MCKAVLGMAFRVLMFKLFLPFLQLPTPAIFPPCRFRIRELLPARGASGHMVRQPALCCSRGLWGPTVWGPTAGHLGKMSECMKHTIAPHHFECTELQLVDLFTWVQFCSACTSLSHRKSADAIHFWELLYNITMKIKSGWLSQQLLLLSYGAGFPAASHLSYFCMFLLCQGHAFVCTVCTRKQSWYY